MTSNSILIMQSTQAKPVLGTGSFGQVVLQNNQKGQYYAVKKIKLPLKSPLTSIINEMNMLRICSHPNIVKLYEVKLNGFLSLDFRMEYVDAGTLSFAYNLFKTENDLEDSKSSLEQQELLFYLYQIALALIYLKSKRIVHRDLKPSNILITTTGLIKIADFGTSKFLSQETTHFAGTIPYSAPEIFQGRYKLINLRQPSFQSDIWSIGVMLYYLSHGNYPFAKVELGKKISRNHFSNPQYQRSKFSPSFINILTKLLEQEPMVRISVEQILEHASIQNKIHIFQDRYKQILQKQDKIRQKTGSERQNSKMIDQFQQ